MHAHLLIYHGPHVEVRGKLGGAGAVLPPCGSQNLIHNSGHQTLWQFPLSALRPNVMIKKVSMKCYYLQGTLHQFLPMPRKRGHKTTGALALYMGHSWGPCSVHRAQLAGFHSPQLLHFLPSHSPMVLGLEFKMAYKLGMFNTTATSHMRGKICTPELHLTC